MFVLWLYMVVQQRLTGINGRDSTSGNRSRWHAPRRARAQDTSMLPGAWPGRTQSKWRISPNWHLDLSIPAVYEQAIITITIPDTEDDACQARHCSHWRGDVCPTGSRMCVELVRIATFQTSCDPQKTRRPRSRFPPVLSRTTGTVCDWIGRPGFLLCANMHTGPSICVLWCPSFFTRGRPRVRAISVRAGVCEG